MIHIILTNARRSDNHNQTIFSIENQAVMQFASSLLCVCECVRSCACVRVVCVWVCGCVCGCLGVISQPVIIETSLAVQVVLWSWTLEKVTLEQ